ncbi:unnamed protein product [Kluyveromyces dobzhanskii CBS 2104]|uniref:Protein transport protein SEC22 n=1 Tax=Kluyveromyces dobzhanskii CBS 2104 TaxID=1427455 RepID=A0A0A8LBN6_9SACH|nr:unnamed protein product [Kluyveromyces dobzhanskii CBS 2104]
MIRSTLIFRDDGLPLCASVDDDTDPDLQELKKKVKILISRITPSSANLATVESGEFEIHYIRVNIVVYFVIVERNHPSKLAFSYLGEVQQEFEHSYGGQVWKSNVRPYEFVSFDNFLQKTKKLYNDRKVQGNMDQLNQDLRGVKQIMTKNIEDLLYRGDSLDKMSDMSASLRQDAKKYRASAQKINFDLLLSQYAPIAIVAFFLVFLLWWVFLR